MKTFKIENWFLFEIELTEKQKQEYMKKYFYYNREDMIIFNFDYNKIKPLVISIMQKKWYIKNLVKSLTISFIWIVFFFLIIFYLFNKNINWKIDLLIKKLNNEKIQNKKITISNPVGSIHHDIFTWNNNILNWIKKK